MNNPPLISVVIPVYNSIWIRETIDSVLRQDFKEFEIIIVDDGSPIDIKSMLYYPGVNNLYYFKLTHSNANVARNYGIQKARGNYIAMLDADDIWLDNHLSDCLNELNINADGLYGSLYLGEKSNIVRARPLNVNEKMINYLLSNGYGAQTSTLFITKASAVQILWDESLNRHQDYDFMVRYSREFRLVAKNSPTVVYRKKSNIDNIDFYSCIEFIKQNCGDILPELYLKYHQYMLGFAKKTDASADVILYYQKQINSICI